MEKAQLPTRIYLTPFHPWPQSPLFSCPSGYFTESGSPLHLLFLVLELFSLISIQSVSFPLDFYSSVMFMARTSLIILLKITNHSLFPNPFPCFIFLHKVHGCLTYYIYFTTALPRLMMESHPNKLIAN